MKAVKKVTNYSVLATTATDRIATQAADENFELGINPRYDNYKTKIEEEQEKKYGDADYGHMFYQPVEFFDYELPSTMQHLAGVWWLNSKEFTELLTLMRRDGIVSKQGQDWEKYKELVEKYCTDELAQRLLVELVHGGRIDYDELMYKNSKRKKDKKWQKKQLAKLAAAKAEQEEKNSRR